MTKEERLKAKIKRLEEQIARLEERNKVLQAERDQANAREMATLTARMSRTITCGMLKPEVEQMYKTLLSIASMAQAAANAASSKLDRCLYSREDDK